VTALNAARRRGKLVLAAHANLAPIVRVMKVVAPTMKSIVCAHGVEVWEPLPRLRRRALQRATMVLAPSRATAEHVITLQGVAAERIRVLPWGLDPDFETRASVNSAERLPATFPQGRVILTVGRWLVGAGDDREWLVNIARDSGVQRHVHFLSGLTYEELSACYAACEVFALPSSGEGFGFVYLEAMARGKPVIGGAHGGAPEVIEDGVTGYVVQHGEVLQLATSIDTLLCNPELARQMGARGRERVDREFRFSVFAKAFKKILRELCES
jgi:glycosyltransferase involved in cell wall biosynthesis